jgi:putative PIN family toxin of toxin-antitoxin system
MPSEILAEWAQMFESLVTLVTIPNTLEFLRDPKDAKFLECAIASDADFFVTGDKDFEDAQKLLNTKIVSVFLFHKLLINPEES